MIRRRLFAAIVLGMLLAGCARPAEPVKPTKEPAEPAKTAKTAKTAEPVKTAEPTGPVKPAEPTEAQLQAVVVDVDGVEGVLAFAPIWKDGALYLHGESMLRLLTGRPYARDWGDGRLQQAPGYTINAADRRFEMRAGWDPLKEPYPIIHHNQVYLHTDALLRSVEHIGCSFQWTREEEPNRMLFRCGGRDGLEHPSPGDLWKGEAGYVSWVLFDVARDWPQGRVDPHWYPWSHGGQVVEMEVIIGSAAFEQLDAKASLVIQAEVLSESGIVVEVRRNDQPAGRFEASMRTPATITVPVTGPDDRILLRVAAADSTAAPQVRWSLKL